MQLALCDDNPVFLEEFSQQLKKISAKCDLVCQYQLFHSPQAILKADLSATNVVFLDIDMPALNGIKTAEILRTRYPDILIVFVTGFIQYSREGYHVAAFRYLMKDLLEVELPICLKDIRDKLYESNESLLVQTLEYSTCVQLKEILYFEGTNRRHVIMHTKSGAVECLGKLGDYEAQLKERGFLRIQRSYLVNMQHIVWINNYQVQLNNEIMLKASERNYSEVTQRYLAWRGKRL